MTSQDAFEAFGRRLGAEWAQASSPHDAGRRPSPAHPGRRTGDEAQSRQSRRRARRRARLWLDEVRRMMVTFEAGRRLQT